MRISKVKQIKKTKKETKNTFVYDIVLDKIHLFYAKMGSEKKRNVLIHNSLPDIDVDFETGTDDITNNFLHKKYGKNRVLSVATFSRFNEKGCLKDVVRAHFGDEETGFDSDVQAVTKEMPNFDKVEYSLEDWFEKWPNDPACSERVKSWLTNSSNKKILEQAIKLQGKIRGIGQHAAGIVITPGPCWEYLPTNIIGSNKSIVTAFQEADKSGKDLSELNILKLDRLKLETLNVIQDTIKIVKEVKNIDITEEVKNIKLSDENLFIELRLGVNHGIFQFESAGMNALIRGMSAENFEEVVAANALYRPGPMGIGAHEEYIKNKFNPEDIKYVHPALDNILKKTNGVLIFQEQLMFLAHEIGGMSLGEGDMLRRYMDKASSAIAKKSSGESLTKKEEENYIEFDKYWNKFLDGASKNGYKKEEVDVIKDWVIKYLGYSFNRCLTENHNVISETRGVIKMLDVQIGEKVLGYNTATKKDEFNPVKDIHKNGVKQVCKIKTSLGGNELECTLDHKIMTNVGMVELREIIKENLKIKIKNNDVFEKILDIEFIGEQETYDLEIDSEDHNFYANDICVSNSHAVSYAYLAMQTLYLKHYYPTEFYTALLNHPKTSGGKEKEQAWIAAAIASAMSKGIIISPPSRKSGWSWTMTGDHEISMGFSGINGLGDVAYTELMTLLQQKNKTLKNISVSEFFDMQFSKFNKTAFSVCVKAGVFDDWSESREYLLSIKDKKKKKVAVNQISLFDMGSKEFDIKTDDIGNFSKTTDSQKRFDFIEVCNFDLEKIKFMLRVRNEINKKSTRPIENIINFEEEGWYFFVLEDFKTMLSKNGKEYLVIRVGDGISFTTLRVFSPMSNKLLPILEPGGVYVAKFEKNDGGFINFVRNTQFKKFQMS